MQRIAVIGAVGAGKSTVARALASQLGLPLVDLDRIYWESGSRPSETVWSATHGELISRERWVLDGDYRAVAAERFVAADMVVWVDPPPITRTWRVLKRGVHRYGTSIRTCLRWTWAYERRGRHQTIASLNEAGETVVRRLRNGSDVRRFLIDIGTGQSV